MTSFEHLNSSSTLGDLTLYEISVHQETPIRVIADLFQTDPSLPGILVKDDAGNIRLISRQQFRERMNCPFGLEVFLNSSIATFLELRPESYRTEMLVLTKIERIDVSVQLGLGRSSDHCYDPIIVISQDENQPEFQTHSLLDFHTLLLAQSYITTHTHQKRDQQERETQHYQATPALDYQLECHQEEFCVKPKTIARLNQQLLEINQILSQTGKDAFQETFAGIYNLYENSEKMVEVSKLLRNELNTIGNISKAIAKISRQVHHLSVKASIIISQSNQSHDSLAGFSTINEEIGNLVSQTFDAGRQVEQVTTAFQQRIEDFVYATHAGMSVARSLVASAEQAQIALHRLEDTVSRPVSPLHETLIPQPTVREGSVESLSPASLSKGVV